MIHVRRPISFSSRTQAGVQTGSVVGTAVDLVVLALLVLGGWTAYVLLKK